jgi:alkanesulfonate monooxygenase SsuD/methylene tetrahydromethanopterin reductase-like flavin-dependent oxidoreductase (luciferase family)
VRGMTSLGTAPCTFGESARGVSFGVVRYGLALPTGGECGDPRFLVALAELAEQSGWDAVLLEDYIGYQGQVTPTSDPWVALGAIAVRTVRVRLATSVTPLGRRRPWRVAQEAVTVDHLSDGRFVLGVGLGDLNDPGFGRFGEETNARHRAEMLDEGLEIIVGLWSGQPFSFRGKHFAVDEATLLPKPMQNPRIPIWIGGGYPNRGPTRRALRWDGSMLYKEGGDYMTPADVRELKALAGSRRFEIAVGGTARREDWDEEREWIRKVASAGATWWMEWVRPSGRESMRAVVQRGPLRID